MIIDKELFIYPTGFKRPAHAAAVLQQLGAFESVARFAQGTDGLQYLVLGVKRRPEALARWLRLQFPDVTWRREPVGEA